MRHFFFTGYIKANYMQFDITVISSHFYEIILKYCSEEGFNGTAELIKAFIGL